jgi:uncharacterized membrane protein (UPF0182 family)
MGASARKTIITAVIVLAVLLIVGYYGLNLYTEWAWFSVVGFNQVFWKIFLSKLGVRLLSGVILFLIMFVNLSITRPAIVRYRNTLEEPEVVTAISDKRITTFYIVISFIIAFLLSALVATYWGTVLQYFNKVPFNEADPFFGKDVGFYVFDMPFYRVVYSSLMTVLVIAFIAVGVIYLITKAIDTKWGTIIIEKPAKAHIPGLIGSILLLKAVGYYLNIYQLVYSPRGANFGLSCTDAVAQLPAFKILIGVAIISAIIVFADMSRRGLKLTAGGIALLVAVHIIVGNLYPWVVQKFTVEPNELEKERPYITYTIDMTRKAYGLDKIAEKPYPASVNLTWDDLEHNLDTLNNVRLWDERPILDTYNQLQALRLYYNFKNVDVTRLKLNGDYRQVMLAAREMDISAIHQTGQRWQNRYLMYTHGYGLVMSPVSTVGREGLPELVVRDIPPKSKYDSIKITRPEIYYGETTNDYVIVNTKVREFDYPAGEENMYTRYQGKGGVELSSFWSKFAFAIKLGDYRLLISDVLTKDSKILLNRNVERRINRVAPFFRYDRDPYLAIDEGQIYWMVDGYTTTMLYPFSPPYDRYLGNYVRNSIKTVVNAYDGTVTYYLFDENEPIAQTWAKIFPELFTPYSEMPEGLKAQVRYPRDMFLIQALAYRDYHMTNPDVFYNKEDRWEIPQEIFGTEETLLLPYYMMMKLPDSDELEYVLMIPFTPTEKNNMIGWLAARNDGENYGKMLVYRFPKQEMVYGPMQIESRISQDTQIAQQLTLWGQMGSTVIRGNLVVIPIANSVIYVEPLFIQSETSKFPELKRVIVAHGDMVVMEENLDIALSKIFGKRPGAKEEVPPSIGTLTISQLAQTALELHLKSQEQFKSGDYVSYADTLKELEKILLELQKVDLE